MRIRMQHACVHEFACFVVVVFGLIFSYYSPSPSNPLPSNSCQPETTVWWLSEGSWREKRVKW